MNNDSNKNIGARIKSIRTSLGLTMEEFGKKFEPVANRSLVSKWEAGKSLPNTKRLKIIAELGHTSVDELVSPSLENAIRSYVDEIMKFEIKQGDQKYKLLYEPNEKAALIDFLLKQDWDGLTIQYGVKYETKNLLEKYLDRKSKFEKYMPYSNQNATAYTIDGLRKFQTQINEYFSVDDIDLRTISYLKDSEIRDELSFDLYRLITRSLDELNRELQHSDYK